MSLYSLILIMIVVAPVMYSFDQRIKYYLKVPVLAISSLPIMIFYWIWDYYFTQNNIWSFNPQHVGQISIGKLPLEEILFFPAVAFSMIFIYEVINHYVKNKTININRQVVYLVSVFIILISFFFFTNIYSFFAILSAGISLALGNLTKLISYRNYWVFIILSIIPFFFVNSILTSVPVVIYNTEEFLNIRVGSIPLEDFLYNFSLLTGYLSSYIFFKRKIPSFDGIHL